ncbi:MAG: hypothetical protein KGL39_46180 [Patescibacteria group bacterium]|nr:hypothetical protein [Patescibacteria group bacterium]
MSGMTIYVVTETDDSDYYSQPSEVVAAYSNENDAKRHVVECHKPYSRTFNYFSVTVDAEINKRNRPCWWARLNTKTGKITPGAARGDKEFYDQDASGYWQEYEGRTVTQTYVSFVSLAHAVEQCNQMLLAYKPSGA